jgi:hypothetical protein
VKPAQNDEENKIDTINNVDNIFLVFIKSSCVKRLDCNSKLWIFKNQQLIVWNLLKKYHWVRLLLKLILSCDLCSSSGDSLLLYVC